MTLLVIAACEDDPIIDPPPVDTAMVLGDTSGMTVTVIDMSTTFDPETGRIYLDMDGDSVPDIRLYGYQNSSPGSGFHRYAMLECMHDEVALGVTHAPDTVFYHVFVTWQNSGESHFDKLFEYRRSCVRTDGTDSIISVGIRTSVTPFHMDHFWKSLMNSSQTR